LTGLKSAARSPILARGGEKTMGGGGGGGGGVATDLGKKKKDWESLAKGARDSAWQKYKEQLRPTQNSGRPEIPTTN